ncbi:chromosome partitioning protein ParA [Streptomyces abyssalis]|uniref:Chromosome partitioning protein ParA n=1 Tax=Streptomyces abyssalis TaxID=933944 RepID=A0A1E7JUZ0_9ACTN|nr:DUF1015 domain-containing protein [Streptomyces abyssalis]OEU89249.1 chromosome partitioning protein ParA [Streptomyces abyssalis]OEU93778.1 chromosome partitioning protein ParA [Streptomyces abyssalis]OEV06123.1 chromosome partitioning protein ParA [Streptomyces nanshensis]
MTDDGLRLTPFRGLRYVPGKVGSLAAVTSPPYDVVVRPDELRELETADPYNIVRLILPQAADAGGRQAKAAATLRSWLAEGVLAPDPRPALYVYEQRRGDLLQRGLIGALRLSPPEEGIVLPHEGVMPEIVEDRAALMRATGANPEPLLLSYRGDGTVTGAAAVIERATLRTPLLSTTTEDGFSHRLWSLTDPAELAEVDADLSGRRALIADGHHRWATYLRLRDEHGGDLTGPASPWDHGLVLLVDTVRHPLRVQAIHRVLPRLPLRQALRAVESEGAFRVRDLGTPPLRQALRTLEETSGNAFLLTDGGGAFHLLHDPSPGLLERCLDAARPASWRQLDATVLHSVLLDEVWRVPDRPEEIGYIHDTAAAVGKAAQVGGTAVLMRPVREEVVRELAEQGVMMPRKSTSFGPKPATGLVLRVLDEDS